MCETLAHHCFAPLLVGKSFKGLFNPIEMLLLGMPMLVVKVYCNIKLGSPPPTTLFVETHCPFHRFFISSEQLSTVHGNAPIM
jgi:hypothetical protein